MGSNIYLNSNYFSISLYVRISKKIIKSDPDKKPPMKAKTIGAYRGLRSYGHTVQEKYNGLSNRKELDFVPLRL